jgi:hypothetical protein
MFVQIMQARVRDADAARTHMDRWSRELGPGAKGWLGGTIGVTDDGELVAVARFESEQAAQENSNRPEQTAWYNELSELCEGQPTFHDCDDVTLLLGGGSDKAGFVQILQGHVRDRERARELVQQSGEMLSKYRPDIIGATVAIDHDGFFTETVAFTSEAEARRAEKAEMPADASELIQEEMSLIEDVHYLDLHQPMFMSRH